MEIESTQELNERYMRHVKGVETTRGAERRAHIVMARGLYFILRDRAFQGDMVAAMGMPHFLTLSDAEVQAL